MTAGTFRGAPIRQIRPGAPTSTRAARVAVVPVVAVPVGAVPVGAVLVGAVLVAAVPVAAVPAAAVPVAAAMATEKAAHPAIRITTVMAGATTSTSSLEALRWRVGRNRSPALPSPACFNTSIAKETGMKMSTFCRICDHEKRDEIDAALTNNEPYVVIARSFRISTGSILSHRTHLSDGEKSAKSEEIASVHVQSVTQMKALQEKCLILISAGEAANDLGTLFSAVAQVRKNLELLGEVADELLKARSAAL